MERWIWFSVDPIKSILAIYVRFNKLEKEDESIKELARNALIRLENGDEEVKRFGNGL